MTTNTQPPDCNPSSIAFIDGSLPDIQIILSSLGPSVTAFVLDPAQDGIQQMADALVGMSNLDAIHIISHGASGQLKLGTARLTQDNLAHYQNQLATIGQSLSASGDLLLYGCNVAASPAGQTFIQQLATLTGADVAASDDLTGWGGNWSLEAKTGTIEPSAAFNAKSMAAYSDSLSTPELAGSYAMPGIANKVVALGNWAYLVNWESGESGLHIFDISDPEEPILMGSYPGSSVELTVSGHTAYVANWYTGVTIINVSNPSTPLLP